MCAQVLSGSRTSNRALQRHLQGKLLKPIAITGMRVIDRRFPILHVVGDADSVVPVAENTAVLAERYRALGGEIKIIVKPGCWTRPWPGRSNTDYHFSGSAPAELSLDKPGGRYSA
jgi:hypothetical protein